MAKAKNVIVYILLLIASMGSLHGQTSPLADEYIRAADDFKKNMKPDSAMVYYEKASVEFQRLGNVEKFISAYNQIGIILTRRDEYEKAKSYLDKALSTGLASLDSNNLEIATTYISLGVIYNAEEKYTDALAYHNKALSIRLRQLGKNDAQVATSYGNIGNVYLYAKDYNKSIDAHSKAMKIREKVFGEKSAEIIESYRGLGNGYREKGEYKKALKYFEKALENKIIQRGEGHKDLGRFYKNISEVYYLMENKAQGDFYKSKSEEVLKNR
ncbi:MAG: hypothetical protein FD123_3319 [Bacteroidetes bacterium]|nr:MAG: hypothetical protein FD123_3319 [Bacteroidota bacterium]